MRSISPVLISLILFSCISHKPLGIVNCPGSKGGDSVYSEIYYMYKHIEDVDRSEIPAEELVRIDSLFTFTTTISGHEGWSMNGSANYNSYYHPEYFVLENPNEFEGKPRADHDFSLYCPVKLSEQIRLHIHNDLETRIDSISISVKPYRYVYNKETKHYRALLQIVNDSIIVFN